jgi:hypothetical protein
LAVALRDREQAVEAPDARGDADDGADTGSRRPGENAVEIGRKIGEVEMAVMVDKHVKQQVLSDRAFETATVAWNPTCAGMAASGLRRKA